MFKNVQNIILGSNLLALQESQKVAIKAGLHTVILTDRLQGEVSEISKLMAAIFESAMELQNLVQNPGCLLLGGEPTVKLKGDGLGGRNQELVLHMLKHLKKLNSPSILPVLARMARMAQPMQLAPGSMNKPGNW